MRALPTDRLQDHAARVRQSALFAGLGVSGIGLLALLGWAFDLTVLRSVVPGHVPMKANTAVGMLLAGAALVMCVHPVRSQPLSGIASLAVLVLGATSLLQYLLGIGLGIDELLFEDHVFAAAGRSPGRMSQLTALSFMIVGSLGLMSCGRVGARVRQLLALLLVIVALFSMGAYGYAMGVPRSEGPFLPVGINTAVCLLLLALGWLVSQPGTGVGRLLASRRMGGEMARRILPMALLAPLLVSFLAQTALAQQLLSVGAVVAGMSVTLSLFMAGMVWWGGVQLDGLDRERQRRRQLEVSAHTDGLTRLANRRGFDLKLASLLAQQAQGGPAFSVILGDMDWFKQYNDRHGHLAGDQALRFAGVLLRAVLRPGDMAARYSGEEFAMLLPSVDLAHAMGVAERIGAEFRQAPWPLEPVTLSMGVAEALPGESAEALLARVDAALYSAKAAGRDRVVPAGQGAARYIGGASESSPARDDGPAAGDADAPCDPDQAALPAHGSPAAATPAGAA